jgi:AmmeMemoRadiSam system protein B
METNENPKVRWLDVVPTVHEGNEVFLLRDPEGITDRSLLVSRDILILVSLMDGTRSTADIEAECARVAGMLVEAEKITSVIRALDDCFLLLNEKYEERVRRLRDEMAAEPFRSACLAGKSYPEETVALRSYLATLLQPGREIAGEGRVVGMVAPHIDYERGAEVYSPVYGYLPREEKTLFVIFGTCHKFTQKTWSISLKDVMTPMGRIKSASRVGELIGNHPLLADYVDEWPHRNEHSIELQLPLIQYLMKGADFEILSILTGSLHEYVEDGRSLERGEVPALLESLEALLDSHEGPVVFLAAADLAHIGAQFGDTQPVETMLEESRRRDGELLDRIAGADASGFFETVKKERDRRRICGLAPIYFVLSMVGARKGKTIGYKQWTDGASSVSFTGTVFWE